MAWLARGGRSRQLNAALALLLVVALVGPACSLRTSAAIRDGKATATASPAASAPAGQVIVGLKPSAGSGAQLMGAVTRLIGQTPTLLFSHVLSGFEATLSPTEIAALEKSPLVSFVEPNYRVASLAPNLPLAATARATTAAATPPSGTDFGAGLNRIEAPLNPAFQAALKRPLNLGIAVLGTGIGPSADLNIDTGVNCLATDASGNASCSTGSFADDNGIDTAVAGVIAGSGANGAAIGLDPGGPLLAVKVLDKTGSGTIAGVIAGLDWVVQQSNLVAVAYIDVGCPCKSAAFEDAINSAASQGVVLVTPVGGGGSDASTEQPADNPNVIAVSAMVDYDGKPGGGAQPTCKDLGADDSFLSYSDFGPKVALAAPGSCLPTVQLNGQPGQIYGMMASGALVAGAAALYLSTAGTLQPRASVSLLVKTALVTSWAVPQRSKCGFSGGRSTEPLLLLAPCSVDGTWGTASARDTGVTIAGTVTSAADGRPVAGATLSASANLSVTTASDGSYSLAGVSAGTTTVTMTADGYSTQTEQVTVAHGSVTLNFVVQPAPPAS